MQTKKENKKYANFSFNTFQIQVNIDIKLILVFKVKKFKRNLEIIKKRH